MGWGTLPTALIGQLAGCVCCKIDFSLNQQKQLFDIQHCALRLLYIVW